LRSHFRAEFSGAVGKGVGSTLRRLRKKKKHAEAVYYTVGEKKGWGMMAIVMSNYSVGWDRLKWSTTPKGGTK